MNISFPKLRDLLEFDSLEVDGEKFLRVSDPLGISARPHIIPWFFGAVLVKLDGTHSIQEILEAGARQGLTEDLVRTFLAELEQLSLLATEDFDLACVRILEEYRALPVREPALAGSVYSKNESELQQELQRYLSSAEVRRSGDAKPVQMVLSPHIDYPRGEKTYGALSHYLRTVPFPDTIFLLGTCHKPSLELFILSEKEFRIPGGSFPCASEACAVLKSHYDAEKLLREEILHKTEHSLELQLPLLHEMGCRSKIVPVLVGSFHEFVLEHRSPREHEDVRAFVRALAEAVRSETRAGRSCWLYAGVDLAHRGAYFGDPGLLLERDLTAIQLRDFELLETLRSGQSERLFRHIAEDADQRRICGFPTLYTLLATLEELGERAEFDLLEYRQAFDADADCLVSFAGAVWG